MERKRGNQSAVLQRHHVPDGRRFVFVRPRRMGAKAMRLVGVIAILALLSIACWAVAAEEAPGSSERAAESIDLEDLHTYGPWGTRNHNLQEALWALNAYLQTHPLTEATKNQPDAASLYGVVYMIRGWEAIEGASAPNWQRVYDLTTEFQGMFPQANDVYALAFSYWRMLAIRELADKRGEYAAAVEAAADKVLHADTRESLVLWIAREAARELVATKSPQDAVRLLAQLPQRYPLALIRGDYWEQMISGYTLAGMMPEARQAALVHFRTCPYENESVQAAISRLLDVWGAGASEEKLSAMTAYLETGQGENPFAEVKMPEVTQEQLDAMLLQAAGAEEQLAVYLYAGRFPKAMGMAMQMVFGGQVGLEEIARCFKAEDGHLGRANRYIEFMKTGQGDNPLAGYPLE